MLGFLIFMWAHENIQHVFELERTLKLELTKPYGDHPLAFGDLGDAKEIWNWAALYIKSGFFFSLKFLPRNSNR